MQAPTDWGVFVNTSSITATGQGAPWWDEFAARPEVEARLTCLNPEGGKSLWHVLCDSWEEAEVVALVMVDDHGLPDKAVKVKRLSQCEHLRSG